MAEPFWLRPKPPCPICARRWATQIPASLQRGLALRPMGPLAKDALPELQKALRDPDWLVRSNAACALGEIGPAAIPPSLICKNYYSATRTRRSDGSAAGSLGKIGPAARCRSRFAQGTD